MKTWKTSCRASLGDVGTKKPLGVEDILVTAAIFASSGLLKLFGTTFACLAGHEWSGMDMCVMTQQGMQSSIEHLPCPLRRRS